MSVRDLLNQAVQAENQIDAGFVINVTDSFMLNKHDVKSVKSDPILAKLKAAEGYLGHLATLKQTIDPLGKELDRGEMDYALFQLTNGSLLFYFFPNLVQGKLIAVGFVSAEAEGLGQMLFWGDRYIKQIEPELRKELA
ncbi:MAG: hypothetical protein DRR19_23490 [Candidatus Parabeggiatoa sp. nov. 1]|nr:MAG: hypothetical protein DRR19_23490 [Gammaproteobacteria bacterium]